MVRIDHHKIWRVVLNLINNAILAVGDRRESQSNEIEHNLYQPQITVTTRKVEGNTMKTCCGDKGGGRK